MSEPGAPPRRRRFWKILLLVLACGGVLLAGLAWYVTTDNFQSWVRARLVAELERISGGRVELGGLHTIPFRLQVDVRDLTIHGREAPGEVPLAHIDRLVTRVKVISILRTEVGFHSLVLSHPVVHLIVYPDGTTNQPQPKLSTSSLSNHIEQLFSLRIARLEVDRGEVLWNDQIVPVDFKAADVSAAAEYSLFRRRYDFSIKVGKIDTKYSDYRPVPWTAEAEFGLLPNELEVKSLQAFSGRSHLEASGTISDFRQPKVEGQYDLTLDLIEAGQIARYPELRRGTLQVNGHGTWSGEIFSSNGKLQLSDFEWRDKSRTVRGAAFNTQFNLTRQRLTLFGLQTSMFGGDVRGDAEVANWLNPTLPGKRVKPADEQKGTVRLKLKDVSVGDFSAALDSFRPLRQMNLEGIVSGSVETRWRGSTHNAEVEMALEAVPPSKSLPGRLGVRAHVRAIYRPLPGELEVSEFNAGTPGTQLRASGSLSRRAALKLSITSNDLSEWDRIVPMFNSQLTGPVKLHGSASFNGSASGQLSAIGLAGKLQLEDFKIQVPAKPPAYERQIRGDLLAADVQFSARSFSVHHGVLHNGGTVINFSATAGLNDWQFDNDDSFSALFSTHDANVPEALAVVGMQYPLTGKLNFSLRAEGTRQQPEGQGTLQLSNATVHGRPVQHLESVFSFEGSEISLQNIQVNYHDAQVAGSGSYDFDSRAFELDLSGHNFDLAGIPQLQSGPLPLEGRVDFESHSLGTPEAPSINATVHLRNLLLGHQHVGDFTVEASTHGAQMQLRGHSQFREAELNTQGSVYLRDDWPANLDWHFNHLDVDPLLRIYLGAYVTGASEAAGEIKIHGPLLKPRELQVTGDISDFFANLEHTQIRNNGVFHFAFAGESLTVQQLRLIGEGTDLSVGGTINVGGDRQLALRAEGHADLKLLQSVDRAFTASGAVAIDVSLGGAISRPGFQGKLQVRSGFIQYADLPSALSDMNGTLVFNQDRLQIETLTARVGGGMVSFGGYATAYHNQLNFDLTLNGQDVRLRYPPGVSSMTNAQLRWSGSSSSSTISGDATLTRLAITPGFDFASYLASTSQTVALPPTSPILSHVNLDVHIVTTPELQMQTAALRLSGNADLHLRGTAAKPVLLGRADVIEGEVYFNGAKYRLERGDITFTNPVTTTPFLDLQASTRVRDYDLTLTLNGQIDKLKLNYRSEPPLPQADIISLLAVGQTQEQYAQVQSVGQSPFVTQASSAVLAQALNSALSTRSQRLFGISHIKVDPQGMSTETSPVQPTPLPAVTVEQQVRDNITLTYTTNVAQTSQQIIQGEYNITRDLMIVGIRDYNGVVSFEARLRRRKR